MPIFDFSVVNDMKCDKHLNIILASASPRRRELLTSMGARFDVITTDVDESSDIASPAELTAYLSRIKGQAVYERLCALGEEKGKVIISADTVVACEGKILGKPADAREAREMLTLLSGRVHTVVTGISVTHGGVTYTETEETRVTVDEIPPSEIERYIASGEPFDKAGGYGIQGTFGKWIRKIDGCYFCVVGLPVNLLNRLFKNTVGCYVDEV